MAETGFDLPTLHNMLAMLTYRRDLQRQWKTAAIKKGEVTSAMMHDSAACELEGVMNTIQEKVDALIQPRSTPNAE